MDYTKETVPSLKQMCKERKIRRYSKKTKTELIDVLRHYDENGHTKNYRKVVVAKFTPTYTVFKIPDGIDLYDKTVVRNWVVCDTLHIWYADGREEKIDVDFSQDTIYLEKVSVEDAEEWP